MSGTHPDHIADADKKVQPARCPHCGYTPGVIPSDFDAYAQANCEHRGSHGQPAAAPLPSFAFDSHTHALKFIAASLTDLGGEQEALDTVCAHISDLTRRLAGAEAQLASREQELLNTLNRLVDERGTLRGKAESAEARATTAEQEAREALAGAHAEQEVSRHWKEEAEHQKARVRELEAFKARVMAWARGRCGACEHEGSEDDTCYNCQSDDEQSNWTPPQAWEVGA